MDFYNFFVNNLFNFSPASFSFPLFYRYLRWKSGLFLQPVCHFHQSHFPNFFPLFFGEYPGIFRWKERTEKNFRPPPPFPQKKIGKVPFPSANLQYFQIIPGEPPDFSCYWNVQFSPLQRRHSLIHLVLAGAHGQDGLGDQVLHRPPQTLRAGGDDLTGTARGEAVLLEGRISAVAQMRPVSSSAAKSTFSISCTGWMSTVNP